MVKYGSGIYFFLWGGGGGGVETGLLASKTTTCLVYILVLFTVSKEGVITIA